MRLQVAAQLQGGIEVVRAIDRTQQRVEFQRRVHLFQQALAAAPGGARCRRAGFQQGQGFLAQTGQGRRKIVGALDAEGLQVRAQHGFHGGFPARLHIQLFGKARGLLQTLLAQPALQTGAVLAHGVFLQRFQRADAAVQRMAFGPRGVQVLLQGLGLFSALLNPCGQFLEAFVQQAAFRVQFGGSLFQFGQALGIERALYLFALPVQLFAPGQQVSELLLDLAGP